MTAAVSPLSIVALTHGALSLTDIDRQLAEQGYTQAQRDDVLAFIAHVRCLLRSRPAERVH